VEAVGSEPKGPKERGRQTWLPSQQQGGAISARQVGCRRRGDDTKKPPLGDSGGPTHHYLRALVFRPVAFVEAPSEIFQPFPGKANHESRSPREL
jgi:hypothetical protein